MTNLRVITFGRKEEKGKETKRINFTFRYLYIYEVLEYQIAHRLIYRLFSR